jgi:hypothetical protein
MPNEPATAAPTCKIVVVGPPGSGKAAYVKAVAARHGGSPAHEYRLAECTIVRAEFPVPEPDPNTHRNVVLQALTGFHDYAASEELLLTDADGILFLCDPEPSRITQIRETLRTFTERAIRCGIDFTHVPVAFQYQRTERHPEFNASMVDQWLGIPSDSVPRFATRSAHPAAPGQTFDAILDRVRLVRRANNA